MNKRFFVEKINLNSAISLIIILLASGFIFSFSAIETNELADNPQGCPYYITMESVLANYPLMSFDPANIKFIKQKMFKFEKDLQKRPHNKVASEYGKIYYNNLHKQNVNSINVVNDVGILLALARQSYGGIDQFYLDKRVFCVNDLYDTMNFNSTRLLLYYQLGGLYYNLFPDLYTRVVFAVKSWVGAGVFPGFFVNNQTTILDTRFLVGMPLLTALYILPGYDFKHLGVYGSMMPWNDFGSLYFTDKRLRKIFDISGIDAFTLSKSEVDKRIERKEILHIKNATLLKNYSEIGKNQPDYITYLNNSSYGMAYLASKTTYVEQNEITNYENVIKKYFSSPYDQDQKKFSLAQQALYEKLYRLQNKHEIILESKLPLPGDFVTNKPVGSVGVQGIVGEKAYFVANCLQNECTFVANISAAPGWHVFINQHESKINRANFAFISTTIPKGKNEIWLIYSPIANLLSYFGSITFLIIITWVSIKPRKL